MRQRGIFDPPVDEVQTIFDDERGNRMRFWERFVSSATAQDLFFYLLHQAPLTQESVMVGGRLMPTRRRSCAFGEPGLTYRYVGVTQKAHPWPALLEPVLERIRAETGCRFDFALCGLYPDGEQGLGWHGDDEADLEPGAPIASLSLGAERDFQVRQGDAGPALLTQALPHGSLLTMEGARFQRDYTHCVPKRLRCKEARINLTFRKMRVRR